jgi:hypothetical protein
MVSTAFVAALAVILAAYVLLAWSLAGWGSRVLPKPAAPGVIALGDPVWAGFAVALLLLQLISLFAPLTAPISLAFLGGGLLLSRGEFVRAAVWRHLAARRWLIALFVVLVLCIVPQALKLPVHYDSGLYHFSSIRWLNEYAATPGLANLHGRLGFNQSFFAFVAALNLHPWLTYGHNVANSFLVVLFLFELLTGVHTWLGQPGGAIALPPVGVTLRVLALPIPFYLAAQGHLSSPWPDLAVTVLLLALFFRFADWVQATAPDVQEPQARLILLLSAAAVTIKTSSIVFAGALAAVVVWQRLCTGYGDWSRVAIDLLRMSVLPALLLLVWMARGMITSGYPFYPATLGRLAVDWAVPEQAAIDEANWIFSWARLPHQHWSDVLGSWDWLLPWAVSNARNIVGLSVPVPAACFLFALYLWLRARTHSDNVRPAPALMLLTVPVLLGLAFWFFTAPSPRFAQAVIWLFPMLGGYAVLTQLRPATEWRVHVYRILSWGMVNGAFMAYLMLRIERFVPAFDAGFAPLPHVATVEQPIVDGYYVYTPQTGEQCWSAALPCTPYYRPELRRRGPSLQDGFAIDADAASLPGAP